MIEIALYSWLVDIPTPIEYNKYMYAIGVYCAYGVCGSASYYHFSSAHQIWLMTLYGKGEASDLTAQQKKALKAAIEEELAARAAKRRVRRRG